MGTTFQQVILDGRQVTLDVQQVEVHSGAFARRRFFGSGSLQAGWIRCTQVDSLYAGGVPAGRGCRRRLAVGERRGRIAAYPRSAAHPHPVAHLRLAAGL